MNAFFTEEQIELIKNFPLLTFSELINKNIEEYIDNPVISSFCHQNMKTSENI